MAAQHRHRWRRARVRADLAAAQMDNRDKDYRYMACSDLAAELTKVHAPPPLSPSPLCVRLSEKQKACFIM